jgi:hypothetical protein
MDSNPTPPQNDVIGAELDKEIASLESQSKHDLPTSIFMLTFSSRDPKR